MKKTKANLIMFLLFLALIVVIIVAVNVKHSLSDNYIGQKPEQTLANIDSQTDSVSFNALLVGTDKSGLLADAIMLVNVNKQDRTIRMLSVPRDTKVKIDGKKRKLNSAYARGGIDLLLEKVKELTNVPINYYAVIKPGMLADIVDCLGGVEYEVERDMHYSDPYQDLYIDLEAGLQILDGDKAEQYCRFRSYPMGDIERTQAQQRFFKALFEQKLKLKYVTKIKPVYDAVCEKLESNVSFADVADNIALMQMITSGTQIESVEVPGEYNDMKKDGVSYYLIEDEHLEQLKAICAEKFDGIKQT